jgi:hypothetical protein
METKKELSLEQRQKLLSALKTRFEKNSKRHQNLDWAKIQAKLEANPEKLWSLHEMERTGGEPDVVGHDQKTGEYIFYDSQESRKEHKPKDNAIDMAAAMGIELLSEEQYRELQKLDEFDTKTSSWIITPTAIRRSPLQPYLRLSQWRGVLLRCQRLPWFAQSLKERHKINTP